MVLLTDYPSYSNDSGNGQSGTAIDEAFLNAQKASIEDQVHSSTNPTVKPKEITDEVVAARGSKPTLDARLDVALNEDGTLKEQASLVSQSTLQKCLDGRNVMPDSLLMLWPDGDSSAPYNWTLSGSGATIARTGSGGGSYEASAPADTTKLKYGKFAAKITRGSATAKLTRTLIPSTYFPDALKGRKVVALCRCISSGVANQATIRVNDGVNETGGGVSGNSTYHSGAAQEEVLYVVHTIASTATKLDIILQVENSGHAYFGAILVAFLDVAPSDWYPERWGLFTIGQQQRGTAATGNQINESRIDLPPNVAGAFYLKTLLRCKTAPTGAAITVRPQKNAASSIYATQPTIAASATSGSRVAEGTYANRCFKNETDYLTWDITTVGSGTVGEEVNAEFVFLVFMDEFALLGM